MSSYNQSFHFDRTKCVNLIIGVSGIYFSYIIAGLMNERIIKHPYHQNPQSEPQYFNSTLVFIFFTSGIPWILGSIINRFTISEQKRTFIPLKNSLICSIIILVSTFSFISSIFYASFPVATLFKSCNLLSVVLVGVCCSRVKDKKLKLEKQKILIASIITLGLILYKLCDPQSKQGDKKSTELIGIGLLIISLISDGFLPDFQAQIKSKFHPQPTQMMTQNNKLVCILSLAFMIVTNTLSYMIQFCSKHHDFFIHIIFMGLLATLGQLFVYSMIRTFKQHIVPFAITTRKISTSVISLLWYGHKTNIGQVLAVIMIFSVVLYEFLQQMTTKTNIQEENVKNSQQKVETKEIHSLIAQINELKRRSDSQQHAYNRMSQLQTESFMMSFIDKNYESRSLNEKE